MENSLPPEAQLHRLANAYQLSRAVQVAARLGLGQLLSGGPRSTESLARATETKAPVLVRLLQFLAELKVVEELPEGRFGPTPLSDRLHRVDNIAQGEEAWAAWGGLLASLETGLPAFQEIHGQTFYEYAGEHPELEANWRETNSTYAASIAPLLLEELNLEGAETVVDVGGGQGQLLAKILERWPNCRGILVDLPGAVVGAAEILSEAGVAERSKVVAGSAFDSVPPGGDVYLLCRMLFNWPDDDAVRLLSRCRQAMGARGRLVVLEILMPELGEPSRRSLAGADLHHFLIWGSGYRSHAELNSLFTKAGFQLSKLKAFANTSWTILEGRPEKTRADD